MKILIATLVSIIAVLFYRIWHHARKIRKAKNLEDRDRSKFLHKRSARRAYALMWITILVVEIFVGMKGRPKPTPLFWFHLICFALPFLGTFTVACFFLTGEDKETLDQDGNSARKRKHKWCGYACMFFLIGTVATGGYLLYKFPNKPENKAHQAPHSSVNPALFILRKILTLHYFNDNM